MIEKIVALYDTHIPYQIPLNPIFEFIGDFKPDKIILGGDMHDWGAVNHWLADQSKYLDEGIIEKNYFQLKRELLTPLLIAKKPKTKMIFLTGNHEDWITKACNVNPNGRGFWELEKNLDLAKYNMEIIPVNATYPIGSNYVYIHGVFTNEYHAKSTVSAYHTSVFYGHTHDIQVYTAVSPIDVGRFYTGASIGCLCNLNPIYKKNKPNRWVNGFHYVYHDLKTDAFQAVQIVIVHNSFFAEGRRYK